MKIFDYIFYRAYKYSDEPNGQPSINATTFVAAQILGLASPIWLNFMHLFFKHPSRFTGGCVIFLTVYIPISIYYKKNKEVVLKRYNNSKYNRLIPTWAIFCIALFNLVIGLALGIYTGIYLVKPNWPEGVLGDYILSFF